MLTQVGYGASGHQRRASLPTWSWKHPINMVVADQSIKGHFPNITAKIIPFPNLLSNNEIDSIMILMKVDFPTNLISILSILTKVYERYSFVVAGPNQSLS